jgi:hypothetical protein
MPARLRFRLLTAIFLIVASTCVLYGGFLWNPIVFDDFNLFGRGTLPRGLGQFSLSPRWLAYASFQWTQSAFGGNVAWYRIGNLAIHGGNALLLAVFAYRLFPAAVASDVEAARYDVAAQSSSLFWIAVCSAMAFALHPAAVYGVAYLIQRTTLVATFFVLLMWLLFLAGVTRQKGGGVYLAASAAAYAAAILGKEHAVMAPAATLAILFLIRPVARWPFRQLIPTFLVYAAIAVWTVLQAKSGNLIAQAYEPRGVDMLTLLSTADKGFDPELAYPLSIMTQALLFFKYLWIWIIPSPAWMSIDMFEPFATRLGSWPHVVGTLMFLVYPVAAMVLLARRGRVGLCGFAMLCPWLMFATELSTVRIQESFVLYRSYLWLPGAFTAIPALFWHVPPRRAAVLAIAVLSCLAVVAWGRLETFTSPLMLWNDAARLIKGKDQRPGVDRVYHNRGLQLAMLGYPEEALADLDKAIDLNPRHLLAYNDRGATYLSQKRYAKAVEDFSRAIAIEPKFQRAYVGRALAFDGAGNRSAALKDLATLCGLGYAKACGAGSQLTLPAPGASAPRSAG